MADALDAVVEIFTWVGFGAGALVAGVALIAYLLDGTWVPVRAVVEDVEGRRVVRWFDDDEGVGEAVLSEAQEHEIGAGGMADIFVRQGFTDRMRLTRGSAAVRALSRLAGGLLGVGLLALVTSVVLLFVRG